MIGGWGTKGYVNIPVNAIESSQPVEKWYKLETPNVDASSSTTTNTTTPLTNSNMDLSGTHTLAASSSSLTTTQSFSKDSISIRIKAKYQSVDILPIACYNRLIDVNTYSNIIDFED